MDLEGQTQTPVQGNMYLKKDRDLVFKCLHATTAIVNTILFFVLTGSATHFFTTYS
jgi:hypothetical protein